eukprot:367076-Pyramimonas_sp.AAC.1
MDGDPGDLEAADQGLHGALAQEGLLDGPQGARVPRVIARHLKKKTQPRRPPSGPSAERGELDTPPPRV